MVKSHFVPIEISELPLHELLFQCFDDNIDRIALVNGKTDEEFTFRETEQIIRRLASGFHRLGLNKGENVAIFSQNSPEYLFTLFAIIANGAAATLPNPVYTPFELCHSLKLTQCSWAVTVPELYDTLIEGAKQAGVKLKGIVVIGSETNTVRGAIKYSTLLADDGSWYPTVDIDARRDVAVIPFSSGTTGLPKGVMLSHYNIVAMISIFGESVKGDDLHGPDEQGVMLEFLPLYHCYGLVGVAFMSLAAGFKTIVLPKFKLKDVFACIDKHKVTMVSLVPPILIYLSKYAQNTDYDLSSVRRFNCGAAPLSYDTEIEFQQKYKVGEIRQGFGMTETTLACLCNVQGKPVKIGSVGVPLPNTEVQIIDVGTGKELGPNQRGEVIVKGPQVMLGYYNNPEATQGAIDPNGWLHTGDIGYHDEEGYFYIVDRIKELIKYKGFQVAPAELESLILTHPFVNDVAVIGIPDKGAGEVPKAFVVIKPGSILTEDHIKEFVAAKVSNFKHLRGGVDFIEVIPKSESGKILRRLLRDSITAPKHKL